MRARRESRERETREEVRVEKRESRERVREEKGSREGVRVEKERVEMECE